MSHLFGDLLTQHLHRKRGLNQSQLAAGILQPPSVISEMSQGKRLTGAQARKRVIAMITWLQQQGVLETLDEANALLNAAGMPPLQEEAVADALILRDLSALVGQQQRQAPRGPQSPQLALEHLAGDNLPKQLTPFIGRTDQIVRLAELMQAHRLLTLTGPGGVGKTRLAIEVATRVRSQFADGVCFVDLAPLTDSASIPQRILELWRVPEQSDRAPLTTMTDFLRTKQVLLILDNCEHLINPCAELAELILQHCLQSALLATSREALNVHTELPWRVPSLTRPRTRRDGDLASTPAQFTQAALLQFEAVALFVARAQTHDPDFALTSANAAAVAHICTRLDGIPLALEMAAARLNVFTVEELAARLDGVFDARFQLLTNGARTAPFRHQTLHATLEWSYALLAPAEQQLLANLSVFSGGWTAEAAEEVFAESSMPHSTLALLAQLVNKSLVVADQHTGQTRYHLLETVRQFAQVQLMASGAWEQVHRQHFLYFLKVAEATATAYRESYRDRRISDLLLPVTMEYDNLRAALHWAAAKDAQLEWRLLAALTGYWVRRSHLREGRQRLEAAIAKQTPELSPVFAEVLTWLGVMAWRQGDLGTAQAWLEKSIALSQTLGDRRVLGQALQFLARLQGSRGDSASAQATAAESVAHLRTQAAPKELAQALDTLAEVTLLSGNDVAARVWLEESVAIFRQIGDRWGIGQALAGLGDVHFVHGDDTKARACYRESLAVQREVGNPWHVAETLLSLGKSTWRQGDKRQANTVWEEARFHARNVDANELLASVQFMLGLAAQVEGERPAAARLYTESFIHFLATGSDTGAAYALSGLAGLHEQLACAAQLMGVAATQLDKARMPLDQIEFEHFLGTVSAVRSQLTEESFTRAWVQGRSINWRKFKASWPLTEFGRAMSGDPSTTASGGGIDCTPDQLMNVLLELIADPLSTVADGDGVSSSGGTYAATKYQHAVARTSGGAVISSTHSKEMLVEPLTARELTVLHLIATGQSNQDIADRLTITPGTAKWYVSQVLGKLGVHSRTQAVARAREFGLLV